MPRFAMTPEDLIRVRHMVDAVREALTFAQAVKCRSFHH